MKTQQDKRRLNLALSMDNPLQREAWAVLEQISPGKRTNAVCEAVCGYYKQKDFLETLENLLCRELKNVSFTATTQEVKQDNSVKDEAVFDFIRALQGE